MRLGRIKIWFGAKGYGSSLPTTAARMHVSEVRDLPEDITDGTPVSYNLGASRKTGKVCAQDVRLA